MVSGVDPPAAQLWVTMALPLHRIKHIRQLYAAAPGDNSEINFEMTKPEVNQLQRKLRPKGHVVVIRITTENPDAGFKHSSGSLQELNLRYSANIQGYFSIGSGDGLHKFANSQIGSIIASGEDRGENRKNTANRSEET